MSEEAKQSGIPSPQADAAPGVLAATNEAPEGTARTAVIEAQQNGSVKDDAPDAGKSYSVFFNALSFILRVY